MLQPCSWTSISRTKDEGEWNLSGRLVLYSRLFVFCPVLCVFALLPLGMENTATCTAIRRGGMSRCGIVYSSMGYFVHGALGHLEARTRTVCIKYPREAHGPLRTEALFVHSLDPGSQANVFAQLQYPVARFLRKRKACTHSLCLVSEIGSKYILITDVHTAVSHDLTMQKNGMSE